MFKNYIKIAFRSIWKNKVFSSINIISLSIGLSASLVIGLMVYYDFSFDTFHKDNDKIYRVTSKFIEPEVTFYNHGVPVPLANTLKESITAVDELSLFFTNNPHKVSVAGSDITFDSNKNIIFADADYFKIFSYDWLAGSPETTLQRPNEVVLTETRAKKYFPSLDAKNTVGKTIMYNDSVAAQVVGVVRDFEKQSDLIFEEFISLETGQQTEYKDRFTESNWNNTNSATQVFLKTSIPPEALQIELDKLAAAHIDEEMASYNQKREFHLQALEDLHFNSKYGAFDYSIEQANKSVLRNLALLAIFLLLLGVVNFVNLNTAQATKRGLEIGIRKTLGSSKKQLIVQFLGETFLLTFIAGILSIFFGRFLFIVFEDFLPSGLTPDFIFTPLALAYIVVLVCIVTLLAGFYPSLLSSSFKPAAVLKNQIFLGKNSGGIRKSLIVFQFVIAQLFIIGTLLVGKQIKYVLNKDVGFKTNAIATVTAPRGNKSVDKRLLLGERISSIAEIEQVSMGWTSPASFSTNSNIATYLSKDKEIQTNVELLFGDLNYLDLYDIKLLAGRNRLNDTINEYVINETLMKKLGVHDPNKIVGQYLKISEEKIPIVGVMADFNQHSLKHGISPMAITGDTYRQEFSQFRTIHIALPKNSETWTTAISKIEKEWRTTFPEDSFTVNFVDEALAQFYTKEQRISVLLKWATGLSVLISCLGLLGLVVYNTERRRKEIGVRKVLGASLIQLNAMLCKEFLVLVIIAFLVAAPIAWWQGNIWLQEFAYKTSVSWWIFAISGGGMVVLALSVMSVRTTISANENPIKSLRTE